MFEDLETGTIFEVNKKKYLVLGIFDNFLDNVKREKTYIDEVINNIFNQNFKELNSFIRQFYYCYNFYESKTIKEFVFRALGVTKLEVCEYSTYPNQIESFLTVRLKEQGNVKVIDKIDAQEVKLNLVKNAFFNPHLKHIITTDDVYDTYFKSSYAWLKITAEQKKFLYKYLLKQIDLYADKYRLAKQNGQYCIAKVKHNGKKYFAYVRFAGDWVFAYAMCAIKASLKEKIKVICTENTAPILSVEAKDVSKL